MADLGNKLRLCIILGALFLIGIMLSLTTYYGWYVLEYEEIPFHFTVVEGEIGILKDASSLNFGHLALGGKGTRWVNVTTMQPARLLIVFSKEIAPFANANYSSQLEPHVPYEIVFTASIPQNTSFGNYNGTAKIYLFRR